VSLGGCWKGRGDISGRARIRELGRGYRVAKFRQVAVHPQPHDEEMTESGYICGRDVLRATNQQGVGMVRRGIRLIPERLLPSRTAAERNSISAKSCFRVRGTHGLETRQHLLSVSFAVQEVENAVEYLWWEIRSIKIRHCGFRSKASILALVPDAPFRSLALLRLESQHLCRMVT